MLQVKPFFDDPANNKNSARMVNHVTVSQFRQGLDVKLGLTSLSQAEIDLIIEKYLDEDYGDMVSPSDLRSAVVCLISDVRSEFGRVRRLLGML